MINDQWGMRPGGGSVSPLRILPPICQWIIRHWNICHLSLDNWSLVIGPSNHVSLAPHRQQYPGILRVIAQLLAQVGNVHVDSARGHPLGVETPDTEKDFIARDGPAGIRREVAEQLDFALGKLGALAIVEADLGSCQVGD